MKHSNITCISFVIAIMLSSISPATIAKDRQDILDSNANNSANNNENITSTPRGRRHHDDYYGGRHHGRRHHGRHHGRKHYDDYYGRRHHHRRPYPGYPDHCFIATAVYNSPTAPKVMVLKEFRDEKLLTTSFGRSFVKFYYKHSPPIANFLSRHKFLSEIVRIAFIEPLVWIVKIFSDW